MSATTNPFETFVARIPFDDTDPEGVHKVVQGLISWVATVEGNPLKFKPPSLREQANFWRVKSPATIRTWQNDAIARGYLIRHDDGDLGLIEEVDA